MSASPKKHFSITIHEQRCKSCGYCVTVCAQKVLRLGETCNSQGYEYVLADDDAHCIGCGRCTAICPDFVLSIAERA